MTKEEQIKAWFDKNRIEFSNLDCILTGVLLTNNVKYILLLRTIENIKKSKIENIGLMLIIHICMFHIQEIKKINLGLISNMLEDILIKKNRDYGNSFDKSVDKFGWVYLAIELDKKKNRLKNLLRNKQAPNYESLEDTLLDIAGYCVLALIYLENKECE